MYHWLSFADPNKPEGEQSLGVIITEADSFLEAVSKTWDLDINPGGEVVGWVLEESPKDKGIPTDTLLGREQLEEYK